LAALLYSELNLLLAVLTDKGDKGASDAVGTVVIKAILPNGAYHTLAFEKTTKMSKVLKAFCEKRSLMPNDYTLQSLTDPPTYITRDMRVCDLKEVGVRLVPKSGSLMMSFCCCAVGSVSRVYLHNFGTEIVQILPQLLIQMMPKSSGMTVSPWLSRYAALCFSNLLVCRLRGMTPEPC
jgi:hypothetical protein